MRPADLIVLIRQRSEWEAVDLGFMLIQHCWRSLMPAWTLLLAAYVLLCFLLVPWDYMWIASIALWWIKPLFDRVLLHLLSRRLFGQTLSIAAVFSALPGLIKNTGLLGALSWRRFSFSRPYNLSIWQLEQLRGDTRKQRHELLYLQGHSTAIALTFSCVFLQLIIAASVYALILLLDPTGQVWEHLGLLFSDAIGTDIGYWLSLANFVLHAITIWVIEPFFVAAGFSLYLNRRTQLEAWDIEIAFRSLGERLSALAAKSATTAATLFGVVVLSGLTLFTPNMAMAEESGFLNPQRLPVSESSAQLDQVMQTEELNNRQQVNRWVPRDKDVEKQTKMSTELVQLISAVFKYLLWAAVVVLLILGFVYRHKILAMLRPPKTTAPQYEQPDVLFGMDIRPESLPDDIAGHAKRLWQDGKSREALSLLYRGALMQLTRQETIRIEDSDTEGDVLRSAKSALDEQPATYLSKLTRHWQTVAYAHRDPNGADMNQLFEQWASFKQAITPAASNQQEVTS